MTCSPVLSKSLTSTMIFLDDHINYPRSGDDDNCCALLIDADNSVVLESFDDTTAEEVRSELAYRAVSNATLSR